jgi:lipoprotein-releasing system ATP-binding protein
MSDVVIRAQALSKSFRPRSGEVSVLSNISLEVRRGERIAIVGASGSGKSTLLHLLGGLDRPTGGELTIAGQRPFDLAESALSELRNRTLGFVYQFHHLLDEFTALENVMMPLLIGRMARASAEEAAASMLARVGLQHRLPHTPGELSGGERSRVAIARALVTQPQCLLADEPTGNLDRVTGEKIFELMLDVNRAMNVAVVLVTHDMRLAERMDRCYHLEEGVLR